MRNIPLCGRHGDDHFRNSDHVHLQQRDADSLLGRYRTALLNGKLSVVCFSKYTLPFALQYVRSCREKEVVSTTVWSVLLENVSILKHSLTACLVFCAIAQHSLILLTFELFGALLSL